MDNTAHSPGRQRGTADAPDGKTQYLTFMLGGEMLALDILCVREILEYGDLTGVPMMPVCIRGVINLRGAVVPVVDLSARFGRASTPVTKRTCIVICETAGGEGMVIGLVVDAVNAVLDIAASEVEPPPTFGASIRSEFIEGIGKVNGKFVVLLAIEHVLSSADIGSLDSANGAVMLATA